MTHIAVIDYGMGNLHSVAKALEHVAPQATVEITSDPERVRAAERVVFPGQGAMPDCMRELDKRHLRQAIFEAAASKPFLGLCIGLQMLFDSSEEGPTPGLGILSGQVRRFPEDRMFSAAGQRLKVPHMGWNEVWQSGKHPLWSGIPDGARFYFVHSYYVQEHDSAVGAASACYGYDFTCAVARGNIFAVQFHPEKSALFGLTLLGNFVHWKP
ncbi:MAG: imidazole glycerol phosphate synthase subunit HisH [Betaproteobacteria bacterium]|nr:imidazole glycerol phosphate synthase subunit HisH [Betaproteobacteria bacterium]